MDLHFNPKYPSESNNEAQLTAHTPPDAARAEQELPQSLAIQRSASKLCPLIQLDHLIAPLRLIFDWTGLSITETHRLSQEKRLHLWNPATGETLSVNVAVADIPANTPRRQQALEMGLAEIFKPIALDLEKITKPPRAVIVPLGFHACNAAKIASLKKAIEQLSEKFSLNELENTHIYFLGGRALHPAEVSTSIVELLDAGMSRFFCTADWQRLGSMEREKFSSDFKLALESSLGPAAHFRLTATAHHEVDSARQIWEQAPNLATLRHLFSDKVYYIEANSDEYTGDGRDTTHGNAQRFLAHFLKNGRVEAGDHILICNDSFSSPRATLIFNGYCNQIGILASAISSPLTLSEESRNPALLAILLREASCILHELVQAAENEKSWFDIEKLLVCLNRNTLSLPA